MASYIRREVITHHIEYLVPVWADHGSPIGEVYKALAAAERDVIAARGEKAVQCDDWCSIIPGDEHVIIRIDVPDTRLAAGGVINRG